MVKLNHVACQRILQNERQRLLRSCAVLDLQLVW